jgi:arginase family enzyme
MMRARYVVTFTPAPGVDGIRSLRLLLKSARRRFGLVAIDAREIAPATDISNQIANAFIELRHGVARRAARNSPPTF